MIYTTYFHKIGKLPDNCIKLIVTRFPPKWLDINKYPNTLIVKGLSPSKELLLNYKEDNDWEKFVEGFKYEMKHREDMVEFLEEICKILNKEVDVCFICYEKDYAHCHRSLLGQYFEEMGYEWSEVE